jgi:hypothetical protein
MLKALIRLHSETIPHLIVGEDQGARLTKVLVSACVVNVAGRVNEEPRHITAGSLDRGKVLFGQRSELVVYEEGAVLADEKIHVSPCPSSM